MDFVSKCDYSIMGALVCALWFAINSVNLRTLHCWWCNERCTLGARPLISMITFLIDIALRVVEIDGAHEIICLLKEVTNRMVMATCL
jgi:hypothetical protein